MYQRRVRTVAHRERRVLCHLCGELVGDFEVPAFGRNAVDYPGGEGFFGGKEPAGQRDLGREGRRAAEIQQRPIFGAAEASRRLGHLEFGAGGGDDQIALEDDAERQAHRIAVRCRDDRLPIDRAGKQIAGVGAPALRPAVLLEFLALAELTLVHIGAARKGPPVAADDRDLRLRVEVEAAQRVGEMPHEVVAESVESLGSVQRQCREPIATGVLH